MEDDKARVRGTRVSRSTLYEEVWKTPMRTLAVKYGISDVGLRKICQRMNVPTPVVGHWARISHGHVVAQASLPLLVDGDPTEVTIAPLNPAGTSRVRKDVALPPVEVPNTLAGAHVAVRELKTVLDSRRPTAEGLLVLPASRESIFRASPAQKPRALRILSGLFKALESRGHPVRFDVLGNSPYSQYSLTIRVGAEDLSIKVGERLVRADHVPTPKERAESARSSFSWAPKHDFSASGQLRITVDYWSRAGVQHSWADGGRHSLEEQLGRVVLGIEQIGMIRSEETRVREWQRRQEEEMARRRAEEERRAKYQAALVEDLRKMTAAWYEAERIRAFLAAARARLPEEADGPGIRAWFEWAERHAEQSDPLCNPDEIPKKVAPDDIVLRSAAWQATTHS